ncbi:MAG: DUF2183 domain-containing protein [Saprospiraceae bacterium]|nr:DUF2183 domain-containing protein [Saprospiraceae bacterium]
MADWNRPFYKLIRRLDGMLDRLGAMLIPRGLWRSNHPLEIKLFRGYGHRSSVQIIGRVLLYKKPIILGKISPWQQFRSTFDLFNSREIIGATVRIHIADYTFDLVTDKEGYFDLSADWDETIFPEDQVELKIRATLIHSPYGKYEGVEAQTSCYLHTVSQQVGLITDIDDTILKTGVTSRFKWRAVYATFFEDLTERKSIPYSAEFVNKLSQQGPVFYVSNSPWNIYPFLHAFLEKNGFHDGPILLRDLGIPQNIADRRPHKIRTISKILNLYPTMPFILLGDSGEKDAYYFREIDKLFPGRIQQILIRKVPGSTVRNPDAGIIYFDSYKEMNSWWEKRN